jgi:type I restriction enzyme S subunit
MVEEMVKEGYKRIELGIIPDDWDVVPLEDKIGMVKSGKRLPKGHYVTKNITDHPYVRVIDMKMGGLITNDIMYVPDEVYPAIKNYRIYKNDIYISVAGTLGLIGRIPEYLDGANLTENANRITNITCDADYLMYWLMGNYIQEKIKSSQTLGAQPKLALYIIRSFPVPLPKQDEQAAIANSLKDIDSYIESLEKLIDKKKNIKQGTMQQLLTGKKRLPGFIGEWELKKIIDLCNYQNGRSLEKFFNNKDGFRVISIGNYSPNGKYIDNNCFISSAFNNEIFRYVLYKDDLTMILNDKTANGTIIGRVLLIDENNKYVFNQRTMKLKVKEFIDSKFLYYLINSDEIHNKIVGLAKPGTQIYVNTDDILQLELFIPNSKLEQEKLSRLFSCMDSEIESLEHKLEKYKNIKQGMMQELLTGRIRLI